MIPLTLESAAVSQQFFEIALVIFRSLDHMHHESLELQTYAQEWIYLLVAHESTEVYSMNDCDGIVIDWPPGSRRR